MTRPISLDQINRVIRQTGPQKRTPIISKGPVLKGQSTSTSSSGPIPKGPYKELEIDPAYWGPGYWDHLIQEALLCRTDVTITFFISLTPVKLNNMLCGDCSDHARKFLLLPELYPGNDYYYNLTDERGERIGMFVWVVDIKNKVNERLKKPMYPLEVVRKQWAPLYDLTTEQIEEYRSFAMKKEDLAKIGQVSFIPVGEEGKSSSVLPEAPVTPMAVPPMGGFRTVVSGLPAVARQAKARPRLVHPPVVVINSAAPAPPARVKASPQFPQRDPAISGGENIVGGSIIKNTTRRLKIRAIH